MFLETARQQWRLTFPLYRHTSLSLKVQATSRPADSSLRDGLDQYTLLPWSMLLRCAAPCRSYRRDGFMETHQKHLFPLTQPPLFRTVPALFDR